MKILASFATSVVVALLFGVAGPCAAGCDPVGAARFICDQIGPEDFAIVPGRRVGIYVGSGRWWGASR